MKCPYCGYQESKVVDSRHSDDGLSIRRRRECLQCQKRFTTYETVESLPIVVIKRDSSRQQFDRNKILNGMLRACEKRPVPLAELERATDEIEQASPMRGRFFHITFSTVGSSMRRMCSRRAVSSWQAAR